MHDSRVLLTSAKYDASATDARTTKIHACGMCALMIPIDYVRMLYICAHLTHILLANVRANAALSL